MRFNERVQSVAIALNELRSAASFLPEVCGPELQQHLSNADKILTQLLLSFGIDPGSGTGKLENIQALLASKPLQGWENQLVVERKTLAAVVRAPHSCPVGGIRGICPSYKDPSGLGAGEPCSECGHLERCHEEGAV